MKTTLTTICAAVSLVMTAGIAGTFFAFSVAVMPGLNAAKATTAIESMQTINQKIQNPAFLGAFMLAPVFAAAVGVLLWTSGRHGAAWLFFAAAAVYVVGAFLPTVAVNVPMNNDLDAVKLSGLRDAAKTWSDYTGKWTAWNHIRGLFSFVSLLLMSYATYRWAKDS